MHRVLVGKTEGKKPLGRPRRRWEDNIKIDLQEVGGGCEDWMEFAQDRGRWRALVSTVTNLRVPKMLGISTATVIPFRTNVERHSTGLSVCCTRSNVELITTSYVRVYYVGFSELLSSND